MLASGRNKKDFETKFELLIEKLLKNQTNCY